MPSLVLPGRAVIAVTGADAEHLLHNVLTCDIETLAPGVAQPGALLTPQGKVMFDFLVARDGDGFAIDIDGAQADAFLKRMMLYRLRSKVDFFVRDESVVAVSWDEESGASDNDSSASHSDSSGSLRDARFAGARVWRTVMPASTNAADPASSDAWDRLRIGNGVVESGADFALGDVFGHDISLDQNGGLDFIKGCYVGQEVVSRMQHRGTARRRVVIISGDEPLPEAGSEITAGGKPAGTLGTVAGDRALAIVRLDRIETAQSAGAPVLAGDVAVRADLPPGVRYQWPTKDKDAGNA
ncbi:MAG: folate-binding protein YgfZ [Roseitalea sp.]|jgi:folate-binding protein YgfZ|nr:folate-binding protein YgfZ [Roseitalea sp.]MBO6722969.1 folate-binding protein YgfZ [Roseitalea sp.]MBO6744116.1 folate-binding protein YgfZ [Roseitalea sp.]